jgi:hypothetical protein
MKLRGNGGCASPGSTAHPERPSRHARHGAVASAHRGAGTCCGRRWSRLERRPFEVGSPREKESQADSSPASPRRIASATKSQCLDSFSKARAVTPKLPPAPAAQRREYAPLVGDAQVSVATQKLWPAFAACAPCHALPSEHGATKMDSGGCRLCPLIPSSGEPCRLSPARGCRSPRLGRGCRRPPSRMGLVAGQSSSPFEREMGSDAVRCGPRGARLSISARPDSASSGTRSGRDT